MLLCHDDLGQRHHFQLCQRLTDYFASCVTTAVLPKVVYAHYDSASSIMTPESFSPSTHLISFDFPVLPFDARQHQSPQTEQDTFQKYDSEPHYTDSNLN